MFELDDGLTLDAVATPVASTSKAAAFELDDGLDLEPLEYVRDSRTLPIHAKTFDGSRITFARRKPRSYAALSKSEQEEQERQRNEDTARLAMSLLDEPMHRMLQNIEDERLKAREEAAQKAMAIDFEHVDLPDKALKDVKGKARETMWTDLYKPRKFSELLGDDRVHRSAMAWLKEWDACVFKPSSGPEIAAARKKAAARKRALGTAGQPTETTESDPYGRPQEKVMLLCGPPGLGKTTLAHVLATQAGYAVAEINASDDRTSKVVTERIRESLETRAMSADGTIASNKPTCVIIDEIDGASGGDSGGFVRSLIKLVQDGSAPPKKRGKGKKPEQRPLQRPIICICNDLYAPVLRPLRAMARIVRFTAPTNAMLVKRLRDICAVEKIDVDSKNLGTLVDLAEGDMRNCLNTLQFIKTKSGRVDQAAIKSAAVGLKDSGTSPNAVWQTLFRIPHDRKGAKRPGDDGRFVNRMVQAVQTCGEYDRLQQGCFEHYLSVRSPPDTWAAINTALNWVNASDAFELRMQRNHDYDMLPYMPFMLAPWHKLFAHVANKKLEWPKADYEAYLQRTAHQEIADSFQKSLPMSLKPSFTATNVVAELAPFMVRILSPDLRPVNSQLVRADEKASLAKLVHIMTTLNLSFVLDKNEDGQLSYKLEPPIDVFVHYEGKRATDILPPRFGVRSIVAKEMDAEALRKTEGGDPATTSTAQDLMAAYRSAPVEPGKEAPALDFFGRAVAKVPELVLPANDENEPVRPVKRARLAYKFKEGYSNAVKLPIKVSGLFA